VLAAPIVLLLSDTVSDVRDLVRNFPTAPYRVVADGLKATGTDDLVRAQADIVLVDATGDLGAAEEATRRLSLAWEAGPPPVVVALDDDGVGRFKFELGADEFVMVGASAAEVSARLARILGREEPGEQGRVLRAGDLTVNPDNYQVYVRGRPLDLTYKEFELLKFLAQRPGRVCNRDLLLREVWGYDYFGGTRTVDVHVRRLRAKLGPEHEALIETIRNVGYRLVPRPRER
jgi:DNA-binding response OmpR family regulator